jgi:F0F1-type ATP synthase assembly protein I
MATAVGIGTWVGNWLDGRFHTAPYCLLGGFLIGLGAAVKTILRIIREFRAQT